MIFTGFIQNLTSAEKAGSQEQLVGSDLEGAKHTADIGPADFFSHRMLQQVAGHDFLYRIIRPEPALPVQKYT
jgi:hypothetical protein